MIINGKTQHLSSILNILAQELDITPSQYKDAKEKYQAVGKWLADKDGKLSVYAPDIYPQGSIRLGTAVKPLEGDEFDVDLVCEMLIPQSIDQIVVKNLVGQRLKHNEIYMKLLEEKNRCWRLNYAGQFHMDILPAIPDASKGNDCLLVPDRNLKEWKPSNPKGYAEWFEKRMVVAFEELRMKAAIEDLPDNGLIKTTLQRSIQLLKRHRDVVFNGEADNAPLSIIITTLAAMAYDNDGNLFTALMKIIDSMPQQIDWLNGQPAVWNPTNLAENFAEKWATERVSYYKFIAWLKKLREDLATTLEKQEISQIKQDLSAMFGETIATRAIMKYSDEIEAKRSSGLLRIVPGSGLLGAIGLPVKRNTFFGD